MSVLIPATFSDIREMFSRAEASPTSWEGLVEAFSWIDVEIDVALPKGFAWEMPFFVALRGALGRHLREGDLDDAPEVPQDQPSAAHLLFRSMGRMTKDFDYPKPFVLQADLERGAIRVRLFGPAKVYATEIAGALAKVASQKVENPFGAPVELIARRILVGSTQIPGRLTEPALRFLTPMSMRTNRSPQVAPQSVLVGLTKRVSGILAWQGLSPPQHHVALQAELLDWFKEAHWSDEGNPDSEAWIHASARQGRQFPVQGRRQRLLLGAELGPYETLFAIGEALHCGAKAAIGCGRFSLEKSA